jgi:flagellar hook-associated protein 2
MSSSVSFPGIASGIDTDALIQAAMADTEALRIAPKQAEVDSLTETNAAFGELVTRISDLQNSLAVFSSPSGGGIAKLATSSSDAVANATVSNSAANSSYAITVSALAKNATMSLGESGGSTFTSSSAIIGGSDSITFSIGTSSVETVTIAAGGMTLDEFVTDFNSKTSSAEASVINAGTSSSPDYKILINTKNSGVDSGTIDIVDPLVGAFGTIATSQATDASFDIAGVGTITRATNNVSDVIAGVTFNLKSTGSTTIAVSNDLVTTADRVQSFVSAYNDVVKYIASNNLVARDDSSSLGTNIFSPLAKTKVDDNFLSQMRELIATTANASGASIRVFSELGISTQRDGTLKFNSDTFTSALASDSSSVNTMLTSFADATSLTGGTIDQYTRFNGLIDSAVNANKERIATVESNIHDIHRQMERQEDTMKAQYSRFEAVMGTLIANQKILTSAIEGLG